MNVTKLLTILGWLSILAMLWLNMFIDYFIRDNIWSFIFLILFSILNGLFSINKND